MSDYTGDTIADGLQSVFISPNEYDSNGEAANVVDGLFAIARALHSISKAIDRLTDSIDSRPQVEE